MGPAGLASGIEEDKIGAHAECCNCCRFASSGGRLRLIPEIFPLREKRGEGKGISCKMLVGVGRIQTAAAVSAQVV